VINTCERISQNDRNCVIVKPSGLRLAYGPGPRRSLSRQPLLNNWGSVAERLMDLKGFLQLIAA
jgi:hypothetical protein